MSCLFNTSLRTIAVCVAALNCLHAPAAAQIPGERVHSDTVHVSLTVPAGWLIQTKDVPKDGLVVTAPATPGTDKPDACVVDTGEAPKEGPNGEVLTQAFINSDLRPVPIAVWLKIFDRLEIKGVTSMKTYTPYLVDGIAASAVQATQDASGQRLYYQQATFMTPSTTYTLLCARRTGLPARMETNAYLGQIESEFKAMVDSFRIDQ